MTGPEARSSLEFRGVKNADVGPRGERQDRLVCRTSPSAISIQLGRSLAASGTDWSIGDDKATAAEDMT